MKKSIIFIISLFMLIPINISALDKISIACDDKVLTNEKEMECRIYSNNLSFIATSISAKVKVSNNLVITTSSYDDTKWLMLDEKFDVREINLISEDKEKKDNLEIARFKVKATNKKSTNGEIKIEQIVFGDENYENRELQNESLSIKLEYQEKNNNYIYVIILLSIILLGCFLMSKKNKKNN